MVEGYTIFTVKAMQALDGTSMPDAFSFYMAKMVEISIPGVAHAYNDTSTSPIQFVDVLLVPPFQREIMGLLKINYYKGAGGFDPTAWTPDNPIFAPCSWATSKAKWIGTGNYPQSKITAYRDYISDATSVSVTYGSLTTNGGTMLGQAAYGGTTGSLAVSGGPADPCSTVGSPKTWTLKAGLEIAFMDTGGNQWYRATQIYATYPIRDALPV